jgi:uncharacterized protein with HEPN domain
MSREKISKIHLVLEKIGYIEEVIKYKGNISLALSDIAVSRAAILMHLAAIAEQFDKLKKSNSIEILSEFDKDDLKGLYDIRTYIAHDYEGVNLAIIEWVLRYGLPKLKKQCEIVIERFGEKNSEE